METKSQEGMNERKRKRDRDCVGGDGKKPWPVCVFWWCHASTLYKRQEVKRKREMPPITREQFYLQSHIMCIVNCWNWTYCWPVGQNNGKPFVLFFCKKLSQDLIWAHVKFQLPDIVNGITITAQEVAVGVCVCLCGGVFMHGSMSSTTYQFFRTISSIVNISVAHVNVMESWTDF